jgi:N-acetylglucosaminyldiphosphoundecaprenol N-acetyl-beta-D-mannosaminyltransferase
MQASMTRSKQIPHVRVGGMPVAQVSLAELISLMLNDAPANRRSGNPAKLVFDANGQGISLYSTNSDYREHINSADIVHADGQFVVWSSMFFSSGAVPDRSSTTDLFIDSLKYAEASGVRYFLFGGTEDVNRQCSEIIKSSFPGLQLVGRRNGFFDIADEQSVIDEINRSGCDVLWVGLGKPREQSFCFRHRHALKAGWIVTCGGLYNYVTGAYPRAPSWMQRYGLEWLHRVATNPRALLWRYLSTSPHAIWLVVRDSLRTRNRA